jgi:hypothetical protein
MHCPTWVLLSILFLQLFKDAWLLHMHSGPWAWQPLKVENEDHGAPELWCHPACRVSRELTGQQKRS